MNTLTTNANRFTIVPLLQKTAVGTRTPVNQEAYSRLIVKSDFFVPEINGHSKNPELGVLYGTEAEQFVEGRHLLGMEQSIDGSANPVQRPPFSFRTDVEGIQYPPKKVITMTQKVTAYTPEDAFVFNQIVDKESLQDAVYTSLNRAQALLKLIQNEGADLEAGFTLPQSVILHALDGAEADIKQCLTLVDHWLSEAPQAKAGETH